MSDALSLKAKEIISQIIYITIATADSNCQPWNTPVYAAYDERFNFYWSSGTESVHSRNIRQNSNVCLAIYDSTVPEGTGKGVYVAAEAYELTEPSVVEQALHHYYRRVGKSPPEASVYLGNSPKRIYKAIPKQFWLNDSCIIRGMQVDTRVEVAVT